MIENYSREIGEVKSTFSVVRNSPVEIEKGIIIGQSFTKEAIRTAKKENTIALIAMLEKEQADLLARLQGDEFVGGLNILEEISPICQHTQCILDLTNMPNVVLYFDGIRLRVGASVTEQVYLAFCNKHYAVLEETYLKDANWIKRFGRPK